MARTEYRHPRPAPELPLGWPLAVILLVSIAVMLAPILFRG